jgi:hypothetical protein
MVAYHLVLRFCIDELLAEVVPVAILAGLLNNNLLIVVRKLVEDELDLLAELQLVECGDAVGRNGDSIQKTLVSFSFCLYCHANLIVVLPSSPLLVGFGFEALVRVDGATDPD